MINVAIMGFGTIGSGVYEVIKHNNEAIKAEIWDDIRVKKILDLKDFKGQEVESLIVHDFNEILNDKEIDIVVETMGGVSPAYEFVKAVLKSGKHAVTSNKALVAARGTELIQVAKENNVNFMFEASVGGGIPVIRTLAKAYAGEKIREITGILNGTTNYILTKMDEDGETFEQALTQAQKLGYAERNPEADVEGFDACRKIAILASLATGKEVDFEEIYTEGISKIEKIDFAYAKLFHGSLKLFASMKVEGSQLYAYVCPMMITDRHLLYMVRGVYNGIMIEGNMLGKSMLYGSGAGKLPTASAVVADIIASARHKNKNVPMGWGSEKAKVEDIKESTHQYFVRFSGNDTDLIEKCKKAFGEVKVLQLEGEDEFAILTGTMKEDDFKQIVEKIPETIKFIRAIL